MSGRRWPIAALVLLLSIEGRLSAQVSAAWHDPSPHTSQFVTVDDNVKLEVLDWGGSGRTLVLLAGLGNTAHVFDDFASKLTPEYHVYGITRRGYGASSSPATGYSADRLGDDVLAVLDVLKINRPVLVGHSIAGEELSSVATRHPERVAGLIYIDAAYAHSYYHRSEDSLTIDLENLLKQLEQLEPGKKPPDKKLLVRNLLQDNLPAFEKDLQELQEFLEAAPAHPQPGPKPTADDLASFAAARSWNLRIDGFAGPEAELHQQYESEPDGRVGKRIDHSSVSSAIIAGEQMYSDIRVPILAIFANPRKPGPFALNTSDERAASVALEAAAIEAQANAFENGEPSAHVVRIPQSNHYVFLSNETEVLREMHTFLAGLQ